MVAGFDRRRILPPYARETFPRWFARRRGDSARPADTGRNVVLFDDTFLNYYEPGVGIAAVDLLESCGYTVHIANAGCCQRTRISHGFLREAARDGLATLRNLDVHLRKGWPVVVCEPSCAAALTDDLPDLIDDDALARRVAGGVMMIDVFLDREARAGRIPRGFTALANRVVVHGHCNQKSLYGTTGMKNILAGVPGVSVRELDSGCCGMAGSFGYEKEHFGISQKIGEDRLFPAVRALAAEDTLVACGFSCRHQIRDATGHRAVHWVETVRGSRGT
jgi:Fe-S oxidoreductase